MIRRRRLTTVTLVATTLSQTRSVWPPGDGAAFGADRLRRTWERLGITAGGWGGGVGGVRVLHHCKQRRRGAHQVWLARAGIGQMFEV